MQSNISLGSGLLAACLTSPLLASSHMDAPLITLDDAANTTDVYAFVTGGKNGNPKYLTTALSVYPFEEPGIGPNSYRFDDNVRYAIHVSLGLDRPRGMPTVSYYFNFSTRYVNRGTILQAYTGVVQNVGDNEQNLQQTYTVSMLDRRSSSTPKILGTGMVPPNNQGNATPAYNTQAGEGPALEGVATAAQLDRYTKQSIASLSDGHVAFAGQREDGFYGDIQAIFDLLKLRKPGVDAQKGYNVHTMTLQIPVQAIGGDRQIACVYATTERRQVRVFTDLQKPIRVGPWIQVGRQGNPLFCEGFISIADKDRYNRVAPAFDATLFRRYALEPELAKLLNALVFNRNPIPGIETNRTDLVGIFIPDFIKVDLSTAAVPLAGSPNSTTNPNDPGFSRLSVFGGDTIFSPLQGTQIASGWPNGRRFGDDVVDIGVSAVISDLRVNPPVIRQAGDNVDRNEVAYNKVMPYAGTPLNGRNHDH